MASDAWLPEAIKRFQDGIRNEKMGKKTKAKNSPKSNPTIKTGNENSSDKDPVFLSEENTVDPDAGFLGSPKKNGIGLMVSLALLSFWILALCLLIASANFG